MLTNWQLENYAVCLKARRAAMGLNCQVNTISAQPDEQLLWQTCYALNISAAA